MFKNIYEIAGRYTSLSPQEGVADNQNQYTLGFSKFISDYKLKIQTDFTYIDLLYNLNVFNWRT